MYFKIFVLFFLLYFLYTPVKVLAQDLDFKKANLNFTTPVVNGRPLESGWSYYEDKAGYIWIGTAQGLLRFDGREQPYYHTAQWQ